MSPKNTDASAIICLDGIRQVDKQQQQFIPMPLFGKGIAPKYKAHVIIMCLCQ